MPHSDPGRELIVHMAKSAGGALMLLSPPAELRAGLHREPSRNLVEWLAAMTHAAHYQEVVVCSMPGGAIPAVESVGAMPSFGVQPEICVLSADDAGAPASQRHEQPGGRFGHLVKARQGAGFRTKRVTNAPPDTRFEELLLEAERLGGLSWKGAGYEVCDTPKRALMLVDLLWFRTGDCERTEAVCEGLRLRWQRLMSRTRSFDIVVICGNDAALLAQLQGTDSAENVARLPHRWSLMLGGLLQPFTSCTVTATPSAWYPKHPELPLNQLLRTVVPIVPSSRRSMEVVRTVDGFEIKRLVGSLDDVAGYDEVKAQIRQMAKIWERSLRDPDPKISSSMAMLLYGPGGTGKTTIARAAAAELNLDFFEVRCSDFGSKFVNESASNLAKVFRVAEAEPSLMLFFDEVDSILGRREHGSGEDEKVINEFKTQIIALRRNPQRRFVLVGATNNPWTLDSPIVQRFENPIFIDLPDSAARRYLFQLKLSEKRLSPDFSLEDAAEASSGFSGRDIAGICDRLNKTAYLEEESISIAGLRRALEKTPKTVTSDELARHRRWGGSG